MYRHYCYLKSNEDVAHALARRFQPHRVMVAQLNPDSGPPDRAPGKATRLRAHVETIRRQAARQGFSVEIGFRYRFDYIRTEVAKRNAAPPRKGVQFALGGPAYYSRPNADIHPRGAAPQAARGHRVGGGHRRTGETIVIPEWMFGSEIRSFRLNTSADENMGAR